MSLWVGLGVFIGLCYGIGDEKTTVTLTSYGAELDNYLIENAGYTQLDWFS